MRRPPAPGSAARQHRERRAHRGRAGVVALVDQLDACRRASCDLRRAGRGPWAAAIRASAAAAAATSAPSASTAASTARLFSTQCRPGSAEAIARCAGRGSRPSTALPIACRRQSISRASALGMAAEADDAARRRARARCSASRSKCGLSRLSTATPPSAQAGEDLGLGVGDRLDRREELDDAPARRGDDRDMRPRPGAPAARSRRHGSCRARTRRSAASRGMRARLSGTPQWLLRLPSLA